LRAQQRQVFPFDKTILLSVLFLLGLGLVQVYSSSFIFATETYDNGLYFVTRQLAYVALGFGVLIAGAFMPRGLVKPVVVALWMLAVAGLVLTFVPGLGITAGGAHRWLRLPMAQRFEPAELFKITFPIVLSILLTWDPEDFRRRVVAALVILSPLVLLHFQPDFGTLAMCFLVGFSLLFTFGLQLKYMFAGFLGAIPAFYFLVMQKSYRLARLKSFLDPWADPGEKGFQVIQSLLSFHSGGVFGAGLGQGQGKLFFLPEAHTDFTLAVLGEELGFVGFAFLMMIYGLLIFRGFQIALKAQAPWERGAILGLILMFFFSVFINAGVVTGLLPTKGLTLPFLSYGGSSLICNCLAFGLILNFERRQRMSPARRSAS
jgi:cell division protein FtsW